MRARLHRNKTQILLTEQTWYQRYIEKYCPRKDIKWGNIVEGCDLHIGEVVVVNPREDYVWYRSLFDGKIRNCSLHSCGVVKQNANQVKLKKALYECGGMDAIVKYWQTGKLPND